MANLDRQKSFSSACLNKKPFDRYLTFREYFSKQKKTQDSCHHKMALISLQY